MINSIFGPDNRKLANNNAHGGLAQLGENRHNLLVLPTGSDYYATAGLIIEYLT